jgi:glycosyltransferase involved in cell wall biosynthesis
MVDFKGTIMKAAIVIPAYNEQNRIGKTLETYHAFFMQKAPEIQVEFIVVLNGCTDNTLAVVNKKKEMLENIHIVTIPQAGKGLAIKMGFQQALHYDYQVIGFGDADMATKPEHFYTLFDNVHGYDGIIASRYMKESKVFPARPPIKEWGRRLVYQPLVRLLFGLQFADYQCGAKLFKRNVIEAVTPHLSVRQWAFDVELLYLCKKYGFKIKEQPTVWYDQAESKLKIRSGGFPMLSSLFKVRWHHLGK